MGVRTWPAPRFSRVRTAGLLVSAFLHLLPATAAAGARPMPAAPVPWPGLEVTGPARVRDASIVVACSEGGLAPVACEVRARFVLVSDVGATVAVRGEPTDLRVDGAPSMAFTLEPGVPVHIELAVGRELSVDEEPVDPYFMSPLWMRHVLLGDTESFRYQGQGVSGALVGGEELLVEGTVAIEAHDTGDVAVSLDGRPIAGSDALEVRFVDVALQRQVDTTPPGILRNGGPTLGLGVRADLYRNDDGRFLLRAGYELALSEYFFMGLELETNFESVMESLTVEVASPSLLVIFPGLFGGVGAVARQLGDRDADAALRLRVGVQFPVVSFVGDFDYWPTIGDWTGSMVVRLSI